MKRALPLALLGLAAAAAAQTQYNDLFLYDGVTQYALGGGTNNNVEYLCRMPAKHFGNLAAIKQLWITVQDQNNMSQERYYFVIRGEDTANPGQPDVTNAPFYQAGPYTISGTGTGGGSAWTITLGPTLTPPATDFFYGWRSTNNGLNFADGMLCHASGWYNSANPTATPGNCGEHPRQGTTPDMAWYVTIDPNTGLPIGTTKIGPYGSLQGFVAVRNAIRFIEPTLQPYATNPVTTCTNKMPGQANEKDKGLAGIWPDLWDLEMIGYKAGFGWWMQQKNYATGVGFVFLSSKLLPVPMTTPWGKWHAHPADPFFSLGGFFIAFQATTFDGYTVTINAPDPARQALLGTLLYAQGVALDPTTMAAGVTNWTATSF